ncbi:MAG: VWA domain-containing protein [Vicinamibacterales bacterium]|nr:VWA domain-containing protein [Vicinamibacterales bacterium]
MSRPSWMAAAAALLACVSVGTAQPQFRSEVDLVLLTVTVTDREGRPVVGLGPGDFDVFEDAQRQSVALVAVDTVPLDVMLLIDASGSMKDRLPVVRQATQRVVSMLRPGDRASVAGFTHIVRVLTEFTDDRRALGAALEALAPHGRTALYDALYVVLKGWRLPAPRAQVRRRALVVLTDGDDTTSLNTHDEIMDLARGIDVAVYAVSLPPHEPPLDGRPGARPVLPPTLRQADFELNALTRETGGRAYRAVSSRELTDLYDHIVRDLSHQYTLGYVSTDTRRDGRFRGLTVRIPSNPGAVIRTRAGYYAPGGRPAGVSTPAHRPAAVTAAGARAR